ncbi:MAG: hypothetical protein LQ341_002273 [Variospora aurantia]|nr:MAG: hypothetical protein LQ341_002273 [Variospora aurantia]
MTVSRQTIALAAVGSIGKFVCEELLSDDRFNVVVISRGVRRPPSSFCRGPQAVLFLLSHHLCYSPLLLTQGQRDPWFTSRDIPIHVSDYSSGSVLSVLEETKATALLSFLNLNDERYITIHRAFLSACLASKTCKRLMPSEYCGDVERYPDRPRFYGTTREPFRKILKAEAGDVEWTCIENGWFMDYFLPKEQSYMKPVPDEFPINLDAWTARVRGTGDEPQSWTLAREVGKAIVALCATEKEWEPITYVCGQWGTYNEAIKTMESFYDRPIPKTYTSAQEIRDYVAANLDNDQVYAVQAVMCDEWSIDGATVVPKETTLRQREKYFADCHFSTLEEVLKKAKGVKGVV